MANADLANKPCAEPGCDQPRVINATGYVQPYCAEHKRIHMKEWEANRSEKNLANGKVKAKRTRKTTCAHEGCGALRYVSPAGSAHKFCSEHYNEYQRGLRAKNKPKMTDAQQYVGFDRDETKLRDKAGASKLCIIDHNTKIASFMDVVITLQCSIDGLEALPNGFDILLDGNTRKGYITLERGERPEGVRNV